MTADQLLTALFNAGIAISVGATVLSLGMTFTVGQLVALRFRLNLGPSLLSQPSLTWIDVFLSRRLG